jgi:thioredoxin-like negative regulator of GroEL
MILFKGGQPVQQVVGYKGKKELQKVLDRVLEG